MTKISIQGFLNDKRYKKVLLWSRNDYERRPTLVLQGDVLDNFSIKNARRHSTRTEEVKTNTERYCCSSILLEFNKSSEKLNNAINSCNFNVFEVGFIGRNRILKKYRISKIKWSKGYSLQSTGNMIKVSLNGNKEREENN